MDIISPENTKRELAPLEGLGLSEKDFPNKVFQGPKVGQGTMELQRVFVFYRSYACKTHPKDSVRSWKPLLLLLVLFNLYV